MQNKIRINKFNNRNGFSLVEAIVAVLLLSIVVVTLISSVTLTRKAILQNGVKDVAAAKAQSTVELLMSALSIKSTSTLTDTLLNNITQAKKSNSSDFDFANGEVQYYYEADTKAGATNGYKIYACAFYHEGKEKVILQGYASAYTADFVPKKEALAP